MSAVAKATFVHLYTASGVLLALFVAMELCGPAPDPRPIFLALAAAVVIDATDGTLARRWEVKRVLPAINGRTIDDIVDYLTYTFLPLLLIWRMGWVPAPGAVWIAPAMVASLFGFANTGAKDEGEGFFLGFPSYWNVVAFYAGFFHRLYGAGVNAVILLLLALLTVLPVRFIYPNLAPRPWRVPVSRAPSSGSGPCSGCCGTTRKRRQRWSGAPCSIPPSTSGCRSGWPGRPGPAAIDADHSLALSPALTLSPSGTNPD